MKRTHTLIICALALGLGACSDGSFGSRGGDPGPVGTSGELGNGTFYYQCADDSDPVCDGGDSDFPLSSSFAVGASFSLYYREASGGSGSLESSAPDRLRDMGSLLSAEKPGTVAVIAKSGGRVVDLLHIDIREMTELFIDSEMSEVAAGLDGDTLAMETGDRLELRALPRSEDGDTLAGALPMEWESGDLSVVSFDGSSRDNDVELVANRAGVAQIYVTMGELQRTLTVTVVGDPMLTPEPELARAIGYDITEIPQEGEESP